ncbi:MAG TPA: ferredoxin [Streptosporangiaceae bacterium]|nr:ferredoxin [Streptosporangiaceae bacterium]
MRSTVKRGAPGGRPPGLALLKVDPIACDGRGLCAEIAPELVTLDDWGYPIVPTQPVPPRWLTHAREAVRLCPKLALRLE